MSPIKNIKITDPSVSESVIYLIGKSPLLTSKFVGDQPAGGKVKGDKEFMTKVHYFDKEKGIYGFPSSGVKASMKAVCNTQVKGMSKPYFTGAVFMIEEIARLAGKGPFHYESYVPNRQGQMVKAIKAEFDPWALMVKFAYLDAVITPEQILNLAAWAGVVAGIGSRAPRSSGSYGTFRVGTQAEFEGLM